jgi:hypothetical protein
MTGVSFTDTLPAGMFANPTAAMPHIMTCNFSVNAPVGATTLTFTNGMIPPVSNCAIHVTVMATAPGQYTNVTSALTSNQAPPSLPAQASITILPGAPTPTATPPGPMASPSPTLVAPSLPAPAVVPQVFQNPAAGGILSGARNRTPSPLSGPSRAAAGTTGEVQLVPPRTGNAGLRR